LSSLPARSRSIPALSPLSSYPFHPSAALSPLIT
jgi:hypothetical protein